MYVFVVSEYACVNATARDREREGEKFQMHVKYTVTKSSITIQIGLTCMKDSLSVNKTPDRL